MLSTEQLPRAREALRRAKFEAGNATLLAKKIGITLQAVSQWEVVPAEQVLAVEQATDGRVPCHELRPDLYPPERFSEAS